MVWRCLLLGKHWENLCGKYKSLQFYIIPNMCCLNSPLLQVCDEIWRTCKSTSAWFKHVQNYFWRCPWHSALLRPQPSHDGTLHSTSNQRNLQANRETLSLDSTVLKFYKWKGALNTVLCYVFIPHTTTLYIQRQIKEIFKQTEKLCPWIQTYWSSTSGEVSSIQQLAHRWTSHAVPALHCGILLRRVNLQRFRSKVTEAKIGPAK